MKRFIQLTLYFFLFPIRELINFLLAKAKIFVVYRTYGAGLGDAITMTSLIHALSARYRGAKFIVLTNKSEFFLNHPKIIGLYDSNKISRLALSLTKTGLRYMRGKRIISINREKYILGTSLFKNDREYDSYFHEITPDFAKPIVDAIQFPPEIYFSQEEQQAFLKKFPFANQTNYAIVKSSSGSARSHGHNLKDWYIERFQAVIAFQGYTEDLMWLQLGDAAEEQLGYALDLRGKTSIRESLWLVSKSRLVLTVEGFFGHAAAAFAIPSVVVYSGWNDPQRLRYAKSIAVTAATLPKCAPCYRSVCIEQDKPCSNQLNVKQVINAVQFALISNKKATQAGINSSFL